jgi:glycosyltransferase involved in cell wall biosynthesis
MADPVAGILRASRRVVMQDARERILLSVIMPFRNEGSEPVKTIASIEATEPDFPLEILAIDDSSDDHADGARFDQFRRVRYLRQPSRRGVDPCRDLGVSLAQGDAVLIIDAHMRFRRDGWATKICGAVGSSPKTIFCTTCVDISAPHFDLEQPVLGETASLKKLYGARLGIRTTTLLDLHNRERRNGGFRNILVPRWVTRRSKWPDQPVLRIPCVIGANYATSRSWYERLHGLRGLIDLGVSEAFLSLKSHLAGGDCGLLTDIEIGHLFRKRNPNPFDRRHLYFNLLLAATLLFDDELARYIIEHLDADFALDAAKVMLEANTEFVNREREYLRSIFVREPRAVFSELGMEV